MIEGTSVGNSIEISITAPAGMSNEEWKARQELACAYRLFDHLGWTLMIFNHITLRVPGEEGHFLINPFGLMYDEITASNLVKIDVDGNILDNSEYPINKAGFVIHSAVHLSRPDAHAVMHNHTVEGVAVGAQEEGLQPLSMGAIGLHGHVAYHDFEGISLELDERERLVSNLGKKNVMFLRNHGLLTCGRTLADSFAHMRTVQLACEIQIAAMSGGSRLHLPKADVMDRMHRQQVQVAESAGAAHGRGARSDGGTAQLVWKAMTRRMIRKDPGFLE